jgi:hypothetical protein
VKEKRLRAELAVSKRENEEYRKRVDKSKTARKIEERKRQKTDKVSKQTVTPTSDHGHDL